MPATRAVTIARRLIAAFTTAQDDRFRGGFALRDVWVLEEGVEIRSRVGTRGRLVAPERRLFPASVDHRTDVWTIGAVLHELLAGEPPFTPGARTDAEPARIVARGVPVALAEVVIGCLHRDPAGRWQDLGELDAALARFVYEGVPDVDRTPTEIILRPRRSRSAVALVAFGVGVAIVVPLAQLFGFLG